MHPALKIFLFIFMVVGVCLILPVTIISARKSEIKAAVQAQKSEWTDLGTPSDGSMSGTAHLMKRTDPDTGATIYVLVGMNQGSIFVVPAKEGAKQ